MKQKQPEVLTFTFEQFTDIEFQVPCKFFYMDSMQNYIFIRTRSRAKAQAYIDEIHGKGKYTVKAATISDS